MKIKSGRFPNGIVLVPTIRDPEGFKEIGVPLIFRPGPPASIVVPAIAKPVGFAVNGWPLTVKMDEWG